jgi:hydrogenase-4 component B
MLIPVVAALIALVAALAGYTMVKFFGVIFLGQPREEKLAQAHDAGGWERRHGLAGLRLRALGLLPVQFIALIDPVTRHWSVPGLADTVVCQRLAAGAGGDRARELRAGDLPARRCGQFRARLPAGAPALPRPHAPRIALGLRLPVAERAHAGYRRRLRAADPADLSSPSFRMERELPTPFDAEPRYRVSVGDHFWHWLYLPLARRRASGQRDRPAAAGADRGLPALQLRDLIAVLVVVKQ